MEDLKRQPRFDRRASCVSDVRPRPSEPVRAVATDARRDEERLAVIEHPERAARAIGLCADRDVALVGNRVVVAVLARPYRDVHRVVNAVSVAIRDVRGIDTHVVDPGLADARGPEIAGAEPDPHVARERDPRPVELRLGDGVTRPEQPVARQVLVDQRPRPRRGVLRDLHPDPVGPVLDRQVQEVLVADRDRTDRQVERRREQDRLAAVHVRIARVIVGQEAESGCSVGVGDGIVRPCGVVDGDRPLPLPVGRAPALHAPARVALEVVLERQPLAPLQDARASAHRIVRHDLRDRPAKIHQVHLPRQVLAERHHAPAEPEQLRPVALVRHGPANVLERPDPPAAVVGVEVRPVQIRDRRPAIHDATRDRAAALRTVRDVEHRVRVRPELSAVVVARRRGDQPLAAVPPVVPPPDHADVRVVRQQRLLEVDLLPRVLAHVTDPHLPRETVEAEPPRVAQAKRPYLVERRRVTDERIVRRDVPTHAVVDVQTPHLPEQRLAVLRSLERVVERPPVAQGAVEHPVRSEVQVAPVVVREVLRHRFEHDGNRRVRHPIMVRVDELRDD